MTALTLHSALLRDFVVKNEQKDIMADRTITIGELKISLKHGLDGQQVRQQRERFGRNELTPPQREAWWRQLLEKFDDPTIKILLIAAVVSLAMVGLEKYVLKIEASFIESIGIFIAVLLATLVGWFSERKSAKEFELLNKVKEDIPVIVVRHGEVNEISIGEVVTGDIVKLEPGDKVPADGVLLECLGLYIDQSLLTGESMAVSKRAWQVNQSRDGNGAVTPNGAFSPVRPLDDSRGSDDLRTLIQEDKIEETMLVARGTMIGDGHGTFVVTEVGDATKMGRIAESLAAGAESEAATPLQQKLTVLAKQISVVGITAAMIIFAVMSCVAYNVSNLPEQLWDNHFPLYWLFLAAGVLVGGVITKFGLLKFFASMDFGIRSKSVMALASLPMIAAAFVMMIGVWGMFGDQAQALILMQSVLNSFIIAVTIIVVAVPEGLPMMVTVSLAMNMMRMARENCLVRKLVASETIGSATVICTDKTGTLTQNRMQPVWFFTHMTEYERDSFHELVAPPTNWTLLSMNIGINSQADLRIEGDDVQGIGNPTEVALLRLLHEQNLDYRGGRERNPAVWELTHNSERKMSAAVVGKDDSYACFLKGAPERVLERCTHVVVPILEPVAPDQAKVKMEPISAHLKQIEVALRNASERALRVIAFCHFHTTVRCGSEAKLHECLANENVYFDGLIGIADPIRPEVQQAVATCREAGIQVKMITGDALPTARAIALQAGILEAQSAKCKAQSEDRTDKNNFALCTLNSKLPSVVTSEEFAQVSDEDLPEFAESLRVLTRSTPMDKLRLVKALHRKGEVVAMTGDGTNDAPALKFADVGLSMGIAGTEVAKEASDIVLVDDNFKSIITGVWWGRTLYQNIQRFLQFQLSVNVVALVCAFVGPLIGVPLPLTVTQLLWINIIMDTFAAIAYSTDPPRKHTMHQQPIPRKSHIITPSMLVTLLINSFYQVGILFAALYLGLFLAKDKVFEFHQDVRYDDNVEALTVFFTIFIMFQFWHKFNCRSLRHDESPFELLHKNRLFLIIILAITLVQIVMVQASDYFHIGSIFRTEPLNALQWLGISLLTMTILPVAWLARMVCYYLKLEV
ncbi:MAG: cation-translocating P-type ATPase [Planctomycetaceae bacterium]|nr:cation-translocating P-type ATPase [Planctomycetaceae bacterium]